MTDPNEEDAEGIALPQQQPVGFWEAVKSRRERSDLEAANDSSALARRQRNKWIAILWGQAIALIIASVNVTSFVLENKYHVVAPLFLMFFMYIFLSIHLCFCSSEYRSTDPEYYLPLTNLRLRIPWYIYLAMSSIDVGAGVIMLLSLQYTSLTSVTLLSSLTLPSTMVFCKIFLNKNFHAHHFLGVILCGFGGLLTIWADLEAKKASEDDSEDVVHELFSMNIGDLVRRQAMNCA